jgi:hypothetical protein
MVVSSRITESAWLNPNPLRWRTSHTYLHRRVRHEGRTSFFELPSLGEVKDAGMISRTSWKMRTQAALAIPLYSGGADLSVMASPYSVFSSDGTQVRGVMRAVFGFTQSDRLVQIISGGS